MPDHVWAPSQWAATVGEGDRPGPLALIAESSRRTPWLGTTSPQWYAVSAVDQSYTWLELPGREQTDGAEVVLSPDGRMVGYFLAGDPARDDAQSDVVGYAVYDAVTGQVHQRRVPTERGLAPFALTWSPDSRRLVVSYGQYRRQLGSAAWGDTVAWDPRNGNVTDLDVRNLDTGTGSGLGGVTTSVDDGSGVLVIDPDTGRTHLLRLATDPDDRNGSYFDYAFVNPAGTMIAARGELPTGPRSSTTGLRAGDLDGDRIPELRLLSKRWQVNRVLGWMDDNTVLTEAHPRGGDGLRYVAHDVRSGESRPVIGHTDPPHRWLQPFFAQDLLRRPFVEGAPPPSPWHPWWGWAVALPILLLGAFLVRRTRGRARP